MTERRYQITLRRFEGEQLTLDALAVCADVHPALIERFVEYGLLEPECVSPQRLFNVSCLARLRMIERLRHDLGANLAGVAVILELPGRMNALQREVERLRNRF